jgi:hypothetical protein
LQTSLAWTDGTGGEPRADLLLAVVPLDGPLGAQPTDQALLAYAGKGQEGGATWLRARQAQVENQGCRISSVGGSRAGVCDGKAVRGEQSAWLRSYVVLGRAHALRAVLVDRTDDHHRATEAEAIVASLSEQ